MPDPHIRAAFYLSPTLDQWWRWADDAQTVCWAKDNRTIAFAGEVQSVLSRLGPAGLPPFGAVTLLLAACRDGWADSPGRAMIVTYAEAFDLMTVGTSAAGPGVFDTSAPKRLKPVLGGMTEQLNLLLQGLDAVRQLPAELRSRPETRSVLAEMVFEGLRNRGTPEDAALVVRAIDEGLASTMLRPQLTEQESVAQFAQQVEGLAEGLTRVDAESLARRIATGVEQEVKPAEEELSPPERVRRLLAELRADAELSGLARLAQDLMAAVAVPRTLRARQELPVGGVSDLTNRGPLDRLLLSELAHDDLTLAVRVAVNEALYLLRESPPREPPHRRAILLDAGVRMWGVPRIYATAVALALAATNDSKAELQVYRGNRDGGVTPVDLTTRAGLETHLGALATAAHPGAALRPFLEAVKVPPVPSPAESSRKNPATTRSSSVSRGRSAGEGTGGTVAPLDAFVITQSDAAADPDFLASVRELDAPSLYIAAVDRDGAFRLTARTKAGEKLIRQAELSLDSVLADRASTMKRPAALPLLAEDLDRKDLPAIFFTNPLPLRLPHAADPTQTAVSAKLGLVTATDDGRLLHWSDGKHGARQLTQALPRGRVLLVALDDRTSDAQVLIARGQSTTARLVTADLPTGQCVVTAIDGFPGKAIKRAFAHAGIAYVLHTDRVDGFSLADGRNLASLTLPKNPKFTWRTGRFFQSDDWEFYALAFDGSERLKLERVPSPDNTAGLFDRPGSDGPWAVTYARKIVDATGKLQATFEMDLPLREFLGASSDGSRFAVRTDPVYSMHTKLPGPIPRYLLNVSDGFKKSVIHGDSREVLLEPQIHWSTRSPVSLRKRFAGIFRDAAMGLLALVMPRRDAMTVAMEAPARLILKTCPRPMDPASAIPFVEMKRSLYCRFKMHRATWPDGSTAWLDGRGMLHLKSSDRSIPEMTLVLRHENFDPIKTAAWSSEGKVCGDPFFLGDDAVQTDCGYFIDLLRRFTARLP